MSPNNVSYHVPKISPLHNQMFGRFTTGRDVITVSLRMAGYRLRLMNAFDLTVFCVSAVCQSKYVWTVPFL